MSKSNVRNCYFIFIFVLSFFFLCKKICWTKLILLIIIIHCMKTLTVWQNNIYILFPDILIYKLLIHVILYKIHYPIIIINILRVMLYLIYNKIHQNEYSYFHIILKSQLLPNLKLKAKLYVLKVNLNFLLRNL